MNKGLKHTPVEMHTAAEPRTPASASRRRLGRLARHCVPSVCSETRPKLKVFVSVDIEGAVGIAHWDEADSRGMPAAYAEFR